MLTDMIFNGLEERGTSSPRGIFAPLSSRSL